MLLEGTQEFVLSFSYFCVHTMYNLNTTSENKGKQGVNSASETFIVIGLRAETH